MTTVTRNAAAFLLTLAARKRRWHPDFLERKYPQTLILRPMAVPMAMAEHPQHPPDLLFKAAAATRTVLEASYTVTLAHSYHGSEVRSVFAYEGALK